MIVQVDIESAQRVISPKIFNFRSPKEKQDRYTQKN